MDMLLGRRAQSSAAHTLAGKSFSERTPSGKSFSTLRLDAEDAPGVADENLEDAVRGERDYLRERLRGELKREPTEEELDEYLRRHTEGY